MSELERLRPPFLVEALSKGHQLQSFDCGKASLNGWLHNFALTNQSSDAARTFVLVLENRVAGYYSLTAGSVAWDEAPSRVAKGLAKHRIGVVLLARLAVDRAFQTKGFGRILLSDAMRRSLGAAEMIGVRAVMVHALDGDAAAFYKKFLFEPSPVDPLHLLLLLKDLRATIDSVKPRGF